MFKAFLVVPPGLEKIAQSEVNLHFPDLLPKSPNNNLEYECNLRTLYKLNLLLRVPNRILVRFAEFETTSFQDLFSKSVKLPWKQFLHKEHPLRIRTTCHKSKLYHSGAVTERIHQAIETNFGKKIQLIQGESEEIQGKQQLIVVRLFHDTLTISIDSSGPPLYMRGYREIVSKAPIRENLAAGLILASGWTSDQPLIDPFCGSGTIPIEAALIASRRPPGLYRDFCFEKWSNFDHLLWHEVRRETNQFSPEGSPMIFGNDRNQGAIEIARQNAFNAKVEGMIEWKTQSISDSRPVKNTGWIITNPPYGLRLSSDQDVRNLYAQFGNILRKDFRGWNVLFLCNNYFLATQTKLKLKSLLSFSNGGINVQAFHAIVD